MSHSHLENAYSAQEIYKELFYQFPKFLLKNEKYKKISNDAKIAYMLFKDRFELSINNNWIDSDGLVYVEFTQASLMLELQCYEGKVKKIISELEKINLLYKKTGIYDKKTRKKQPNRYYLLKPILSKDDVIIQKNPIQSIDIPIDAKIAYGGNADIPIDAKIAYGQKVNNINDSKLNAKIAQELDNNKDIKDTYKDTEKERIQNSILLENFSKTLNNPFLGTDCLDRISQFSNTIQEAQNTVGIIIRAKNQVEKKKNTVIVAEYYQDEIKLKLTELYLKIKTDETIKNKDSYMFIAFLKMFKDFVNAEQAANNTFKPTFHIPIE